MTFASPDGPWTKQRGRRLTNREYARFQGFDIDTITVPNWRWFRKTLGNSMIVAAIQQIMRPFVATVVGDGSLEDAHYVGDDLKKLVRQAACDPDTDDEVDGGGRHDRRAHRRATL